MARDIESGAPDSAPLLGRNSFLRRLTGGAPAWGQLFGGRRARDGPGEGPPPAPTALEQRASGAGAPAAEREAGPAGEGSAPPGCEIQAAEVQAEAQPRSSGEGEAEGLKGGSPRAGAEGEGAAAALSAVVRRYFTRSPSTGGLQPKDSGIQPTCLICLENLSPEDFESGEAFSLDCQCRGEMALRHRTCAEKWARVKGDRLCDVCKAPVQNLPDFTPRAASDAGSEGSGFDADRLHGGALGYSELPGSADLVFDCVRVAWVAMIICILFFEMSLLSALVAGMLVGVGYSLFARAMYRQQLAAIQRERGMAVLGRAAAETQASPSPSVQGGSQDSSPRASGVGAAPPPVLAPSGAAR